MRGNGAAHRCTEVNRQHPAHVRQGNSAMRIRNSSRNYGAVAIAMHWIVVLLVLAGWATGQLGDALPRAAHESGLFVHISLGLALFGFALARLSWRLADPPPAPE